MTLYGRRGALAELDRQLAEVSTSGRGRMLAVQGRRQVGKSTLLTTFVESAAAASIYTTAVKNAPVHLQLAAFATAARQSARPVHQVGLIFSAAPTTWTEAFNRVALAARAGPVVLVVDEFPWAVERSDTLEGELQVAWDGALENLPVLLVLVGSDVAMMSRLTDHDRPLFGRATPVVVPPLNPAELAEALPSASAAELFDAYLVTGGYPRLVRSCAAAQSADRYVAAALQDASSDLVVAARLTLDAEFHDSRSSYRVLAAIGSNAVTRPGFNDVADALSDPADRAAARTAISRALGTLTGEKRIVEILVPSGAAASSKLRRYRITDPYLRFWFTFVEGQVDNISRGRPDLAKAAVHRGWSTWRGSSVEPVVQDALWRLGATRPELEGLESVGSWWNRDNSVEVDLVGRGRARVGWLGTIKWRARGGITEQEVAALAAQRSLVPGAAEARLVGVCPSGARRGAALDLVLTAEDLLAAWQ